MEPFLIWLEKYDLLIELIITILTITLSLLALFQTQNIAKKQLKQEENIAKQQVYLQERQMKISVYEQKNEINKALNIVFDSISKMSLVIRTLRVENLNQDKLYQLLNRFVDDINFKNISYTLEQSQFFMGTETSLNIRKVRVSFLTITTNIDCLNLLKQDEELKNMVIEEIRNACVEIETLQPLLESAMLEELKLT